MRARLLPKLMAWLLVPCACRIMKKMNAPISSTGSSAVISNVMMLPAALGSTGLNWISDAHSCVVACPAALQIWL